ncbi:MAG: hypothetical protein ACKVX9_23100 [Blastocatellia bacterium]
MSNLLVVLVTALAIVNGGLSSWFLGERLSLRARLSIGAVVGLALLAWTGFLTALVFGLGPLSIGVTVGLFLGMALWLFRRVGRGRLLAAIDGKAWDWGEILYVAGWSLLLAALFSRVVMFDADGLRTAPANNFGDLPFHFSVITSFAYGENLPPRNPIFAGMKFTYPFLIDFLTAFFIRCGAGWRVAFFVENFALALALVGVIEFMTMQIFGQRLAARLAPVVFLFNGGLGFINFFRELFDPIGSRLEFLVHLPLAYTMNNALATPVGAIPLRWGNVFTTLLIPQRSMLFGLPIVALIIALWWMAATGEEGGEETPVFGGISPRRRLLLAAGVLAGMLPMLHAHGFFSVMIASVPMALLFFSRDWLAFFLPAGLLALPQALYLRGTPVRIKMAEKLFHWEAGDSDPALFWAVNFGVLIGVALAALLLKRFTNARQARFYTPFILWFLVPCIWELAPWGWDNIKVFVYWSLASAPFAAALLASMFTDRRWIPRPFAAVLLAALTLSGAIDVFRALSPVENLVLFGREEMEVAELLRRRTPPRALILHAPIHNSAVALSGRQSLLGYPGHLWTHGIEYAAREQDVRAIYQGGSASLEPLARYGVDYLVIGPRERAELLPDENDFLARYPVVIEHAGYRVFRIRGD